MISELYSGLTHIYVRKMTLEQIADYNGKSLPTMFLLSNLSH